MPPQQSTRLAWLGTYARTNPLLALWSVMLFCGGSVLLSYHASLAYLPDFNLVDLAGLMASVTLIGLMLVVFFLFSCFMPGLTLRWIEHQWPLVPYRRYFNMTELVVLWISSIAIWAAYVVLSDSLPVVVPVVLKPAISMAGLACASIVVVTLASRRTAAGFSLRHWKHRLIVRHVVAFPVWIALFVFPIHAALKFASSADHSWEIPLAVGAVAFLTVFNGLVYAAPLSDIRSTVTIDKVFIVMLIPFGLGLATAFPQTVMQSLALGHRHAATLTVTGKSCHSLARFGIPCTPQDSQDGAIELENINVLSRVGTTVLLELLVQQAGSDAAAKAPQAGRTGVLHLAPQRRPLYCPPSPAGTTGTCTACDARLLQRARLRDDTGTTILDAYRSDLVCVQITVAKSDILNIAFGAGRQYRGYSAYSLPQHATR